jgi:glutathione S-transferase
MKPHLYVGSKRYSSWSLRPYLALVHAGELFDTTTILLDTPTSKAEIAAVNPAGLVPVLHVDGAVIWDSLAICEYVAERNPAAKLWPEDPLLRAKARSISCEMHSSFAALRSTFPFQILETGISSPAGEPKPQAFADAKRIEQIWREELSEKRTGGPFLFGAFTIADAMFAPVASRFRTYGIDVDSTSRAYIDAIFSLPGVKQWMTDAESEPKSR